MSRRLIAFALPLLLLLAVLGVLALELPQEPSPAPLSVLVLRDGEGNAALVSCGGQTLLFPLGDAADEDDLTRYLHRNRSLRITQTVRADRAMQKELRLVDAVCLYDRQADGTLTLRLTHGDNLLTFRFAADTQPLLRCNQQEAELLRTDLHSVRVLSDGTGLSLRPELNGWD